MEKVLHKGSSRPKGGAYYPSTRPWVPCCYPLCPGHQGKLSFKYLDSVGEGEHGLKCMGCGTAWAESIETVGMAGQLARGAGEGLSPTTANRSLVSPADPKSPFTTTDDIDIVLLGANSNAPFAKTPTEATAFRQLPEAARKECPQEFLPLLERHLLGPGLSDEELEPFKAAMAGGHDLGKRFMAAIAVGKAALDAKILPPTAAPRVHSKHGPITPAQEEAQAYSAWTAAVAETQKQNKARRILVNHISDLDHEEVVLQQRHLREKEAPESKKKGKQKETDEVDLRLRQAMDNEAAAKARLDNATAILAAQSLGKGRSEPKKTLEPGPGKDVNDKHEEKVGINQLLA